jgi:hypothetical protein
MHVRLFDIFSLERLSRVLKLTERRRSVSRTRDAHWAQKKMLLCSSTGTKLLLLLLCDQ